MYLFTHDCSPKPHSPSSESAFTIRKRQKIDSDLELFTPNLYISTLNEGKYFPTQTTEQTTDLADVAACTAKRVPAFSRCAVRVGDRNSTQRQRDKDDDAVKSSRARHSGEQCDSPPLQTYPKRGEGGSSSGQDSHSAGPSPCASLRVWLEHEEEGEEESSTKQEPQSACPHGPSGSQAGALDCLSGARPAAIAPTALRGAPDLAPDFARSADGLAPAQAEGAGM
uniref:Uncharacterized protein n=1 Tax=Tetraselmis sp. GSL018 TaxID=582737 RepID=A0A061S1P9_9CHLO|mmetsp:Transcript_10498/g.24842  ORF Transcript_10498/g.24842 Transcript_10498/m.24842 type:complete len:225 (+) Transcript_10498:123-797(+)